MANVFIDRTESEEEKQILQEFFDESHKLYDEMDHLTYEQYRSRYRAMYDILHKLPNEAVYLIHLYGLDNKADRLFKDEIRTDKRIFKINVSEIPDNEVETYIKGIMDRTKSVPYDMATSAKTS